MMVGGPEGSTSGLRFNPRESAEELQEDSSVGREDSDERARHDAKKRQEQEKRAHKLQGLQHMKIKIPQKNPEDEEDSQVKQQAELGQMTGQVGQNEAIDGANPNASGLGANMMLSTAPFIDDAFDMIRKKRGEPKYDDEKPKATTTIDTAMQRRRAAKGRRSKKQGKKTTETETRGKGKGSKRSRVGARRNPKATTSMMAGSAPFRSFGGFYGYQQPTRFGMPRLTSATHTQARTALANPQKKVAQDVRQALRQESPPLDDPIPTPTVSPEARRVRAPRGSRDAMPHKKALHLPRETITPGGKGMSRATSLAGGAGGIGSTDAILASEEFLLKRAQKVKLTGMSPRDRIEYRQLIDQLNHLMRRMMRKEDKSMQGATEGATDNASGGLTSAPTGATEADPDDDATRWGAHPYDLYVRRGGV